MHHVLNRQNDADLTVPLCRNCHALVTEGIRQCNASTAAPRTILDRIVAVLRALAAFFRQLADALLALADRLLRFMGLLDRTDPTWRANPDAQ